MNNETLLEVLDNDMILYKLSLITWCQNKVLKIMLNPYIRQVEIRDNFRMKLELINKITIKSDNPLVKSINDSLDLKINNLTRHLYHTPSKL